MKKLEQIYEGKAKKVYRTDDENLYIIDYKDDATAFDGKKKGTIDDKGIVNNIMSAKMFTILEKAGIPTHFVEQLSDRSMLVRAVKIVPIEVIVRNIATGSLTKRLGIPDGQILSPTVLEYCYKSDELSDPQINEFHVRAMDLATDDEMKQINYMSFKVNELLQPIFKTIKLTLVDFKLEFGRLADGKIVLADEISPDTSRLWDMETNERMDKDRFRRDLGNVRATYQEVLNRVNTIEI